MNFEEEYLQIKALVKDDLAEIDAYFNSAESFDDNLKNFLTAPSKRLRPLIAFLFMRAKNLKVNEPQIKLQIATELVHSASLLHDDVIDCASTRRSLKSLNVSSGNRLAVVFGDLLLSKALEIISEFNSITTVNIFTSALNSMCLGEINQNKNRFKIPSMDEYLQKTKQKTASLFVASLKAALISAGEIETQETKEFAENFGIAFQIRDDINNLINGGNDLKDGIYNAPIIFSDNVSNFKKGIEKAKDLMDNYFEKALSQVEKLDENEYKAGLIKLIRVFQNV